MDRSTKTELPKTKEIVMRRRDGTITARIMGWLAYNAKGEPVYVAIPQD